MFEIYVSAADVTVRQKETITEGRVGLRCKMGFSKEWEGLAKTAVFEGAESRDVVMTGDTVTIPAECLFVAGYPLRVGVCGKSADGTVVIPTVYASLGKIGPSVRPSGKEPAAPTPDVVAQIQQQSANAVQMAQEVKVAAELGKLNGKDGADGGWYTPAVSQPDANTLRFAFTPSREDMPAAAPANIVLPTGSSAVTRANWMENESTQPGFVQNRTHYVKDCIFYDLGGKFTYRDDGTGIFFGDSNADIAFLGTYYAFAIGWEYKVIWDGTEYDLECQPICISGWNTTMIGNASLLESSLEDTGEPFALVGSYEALGPSIVTSQTGTQHTVEVFQVESTVKRLPVKFVPVFDENQLRLRSSSGTLWGLSVDDTGVLIVSEI